MRHNKIHESKTLKVDKLSVDSSFTHYCVYCTDVVKPIIEWDHRDRCLFYACDCEQAKLESQANKILFKLKENKEFIAKVHYEKELKQLKSKYGQK